MISLTVQVCSGFNVYRLTSEFSKLLLALASMHFTILVILLYVNYGFCQQNCSQSSLQTVTTTADIFTTLTHTVSILKKSMSDIKQATVKIQIDELNGSVIVNLTVATVSSTVSLTRPHESFRQSSSSEINSVTMLWLSIYQTGHQHSTISLQSISVFSTEAANFTELSDIKWTFLSSQKFSTVLSLSLFTSSEVSFIVFKFYNLLLCGGLSIAIILIS